MGNKNIFSKIKEDKKIYIKITRFKIINSNCISIDIFDYALCIYKACR